MNLIAAARMPITAPLVGSSVYAPVVLVVVGVLLLTVSAKLQIPLRPVPTTMQTYVILVVAMAYGTRLGVATVVAYLLAGAVGLPVFAQCLRLLPRSLVQGILEPRDNRAALRATLDSKA